MINHQVDMPELIAHNNVTAYYVKSYGGYWKVLINSMVKPEVGYTVYHYRYATREAAESACFKYLTNMITKQSSISILANLSRGYATDSQCDAALAREAALVSALQSSYDAMLSMRAMLSRNDISLKGSPIEATIQATALLLYPVLTH